jgi:cytochrome d ubiquinol oxidase subunit I
MRTSQAVTGADGLPVGYATLVVVYLGVALAVAWILRRLAQVPLDLPAAPPPPIARAG